MTITLTPETEAKLKAKAAHEGQDINLMANALLAEALEAGALSSDTRPGTEDPTLALFAQWDEEDAQMTPQEIEEAQREFEEFKQNINAERTRAGARVIYP